MQLQIQRAVGSGTSRTADCPSERTQLDLQKKRHCFIPGGALGLGERAGGEESAGVSTVNRYSRHYRDPGIPAEDGIL